MTRYSVNSNTKCHRVNIFFQFDQMKFNFNLKLKIVNIFSAIFLLVSELTGCIKDPENILHATKMSD